jgi:hypothetical protein
MDVFKMYKAIRKLKKGHRKNDPALVFQEGHVYYNGHPGDIMNMIIRELTKDSTLAPILYTCLNCYKKGITFDEVLRAQDAGEL